MVEKVLQELNGVSDRSTTVMNVWKNIRVAPVVIGQDHQLELRQFRESVQGIIEKFTSDERHSRALIDSVQSSMTQILAVEGVAAFMGVMWYSSFWMWLHARNGSTNAERFFSIFTGTDTSLAREFAKPIPLLLLAAGTALMGLSGMNILQYRRNVVKRKLAREADMCQEKLTVKLDTFVQDKARKTVADTTEWLRPFLQAIKTENDRIDEMKTMVGQWHEEVDDIATQIEDVTESLAHPVFEETNAYPVSKPMAYPTAVPLGPAPRNVQPQRPKPFLNVPPSYNNELPAYPSFERVSSAPLPSPMNYYSPTTPKHFTYQQPYTTTSQPYTSPNLYRQATPPPPISRQHSLPTQMPSAPPQQTLPQSSPTNTSSSSSPSVTAPVDEETEAERVMNKRAIAILA